MQLTLQNCLQKLLIIVINTVKEWLQSCMFVIPPGPVRPLIILKNLQASLSIAGLFVLITM